MKKFIAILISFVLIFGLGAGAVYATDYSAYSNSSKGWGLSRNTVHETPGGTSSAKALKKYKAYYLGDTSRQVCYLTFDCGYENGHTKTILNTLKKYNIKAVFFVTGTYVRDNPELVKRMKKEGHLVGNHTQTHPNLTTKSVSGIRQELKSVEEAMEEGTGYTLDKIMRPPEGAYSDRVLKVLKDMGYVTLFWSNAWMDWDVNNQPSESFVLGQFETYYHNGIVPLMHVISSADTKALPSVIRFLKNKGFTFERFDNYYKKDPRLKVNMKAHVYDGKRASKFLTVKSRSDGKKTITFYKKSKKLKKAPKNAGTYFVEVVQETTDKYREATVKKKFKITKAKPDVGISLVTDEEDTAFDDEALTPAGEEISDTDENTVQYPTVKEGSAYSFKVNTENKNGEITYIYYDEDGDEISKPETAGVYSVTAKVSATKNYKSAKSERLYFAIIA